MLTNVKFVCTATAGTGHQLYLKENITKVYMMAFSFCHIMDHFFFSGTCFIQRVWANSFYPHKESVSWLEMWREKRSEAWLAHMNEPFNGKKWFFLVGNPHHKRGASTMSKEKGASKMNHIFLKKKGRVIQFDLLQKVANTCNGGNIQMSSQHFCAYRLEHRNSHLKVRLEFSFCYQKRGTEHYIFWLPPSRVSSRMPTFLI